MGGEKMKRKSDLDQEGEERLRNFMASIKEGKRNEDDLGNTIEVDLNKKKLLTKTYKLSFGGILTRVSRNIEDDEAEKHRNVFCKHSSFCVGFACDKRMASFSCKNCPFFKN